MRDDAMEKLCMGETTPGRFQVALIDPEKSKPNNITPQEAYSIGRRLKV